MAWVGVDLDGTLAHHYWPEDGPYNPLRIGKPIPRMVAYVRDLLSRNVEVRIFTARVAPQPDAEEARADGVPEEIIRQHTDEIPTIIAAIEQWCLAHLGRKLAVTATKDYGCIAIYDDRAYRVRHNTGEILL